MLFNNKDYRYIAIDRFISMIDEEENASRYIDGYSANLYESFIYGEYEYIGGGTVVFPGTLYKTWTTTKYHDSDSYSGWADDAGRVTLSKDSYEETIVHKIYRRDLTSLEDELNRYAEYCYYYISGISNMIDRALKDADASGASPDPFIYVLKDVVDKINWNETKKSVSYVIGLKKALCRFYESHYGEPFTFNIQGKQVVYPFISKIMAPGEDKYLAEKDVREREKIHFDYLEKAANLAETFKIGKNPRKSGKFVVSIVFLVFWAVFTTFGLVTGFGAGIINATNPFLYALEHGAYLAFLALPFFIIGLSMNISVNKQYKKYKDLNDEYQKYLK